MKEPQRDVICMVEDYMRVMLKYTNNAKIQIGTKWVRHG